MNKSRPWQTLDRFVEIRSPWLTLIGERLQDDQGQILDYWRVEKADSVVIVTIQAGKFLLPAPTYRPGVGEATLDFPGGRVNPEQTPIAAVPGIVSRELGVSEDAIANLTPLNSTGWAINSSFSNQSLYGFVAELDPTVAVNSNRIGITYPTTSAGIHSLLQELTCLQCHAVLLEWQSQRIIAEG